jgi:branched-chain amino acid transport system substrate-binding protein
VLNWGWGVMNSTALKEAVATGYPREKMYGVWWAGAEPDVKDVGDGAKGYNAVMMQHGAEPNPAVVKEILAKVHDKARALVPRPKWAGALHARFGGCHVGGRRRAPSARALWQRQGHDR